MLRRGRRSCLDALAVALTAFAFAVPAAPVSAAAPTVDAVKFLSSPQSGDTYGVGERITVEVEWSESVLVTGSPRLALTVGSNTRYAEYAGGVNPRFRYTVGTADRDLNGLSVAAGALELNGGAIRSESTSENADIGLGSHAITDDSSHKVDGSIAVAPIVTAVRITTRPDGGRAYFRTGERIRVEVRFGKPVSANLPPRLALSIGATTRQVNAFTSSGHSEFLTFDYTVQADDYDPDGFSIAAGALTLPAGGRVVDRGLRAANLNLGRHAISGAAGHRVNNAPPSFGTTTVANRTFALDAPAAPLVLPEATGEGTLSYTLTPSTLPPGLTWTPATRTISGTPTAVTAARTYTWKATDSEDETATLTFTIAVAEIPIVSAVTFTSSPQSGDTYGVGERITVEVEWSESVTVTGSPRLALTVGSNTRYAEYAGGLNPRFRYTVGTADRDTNGLSVAAGALELNGGAIRRGSTNENADTGLGSHAITDDSSHKVDGSIAVAPIVTAVRIATGPSGGRAYFRTGERIRVEVRFGKPVSANLPPRLALSIGAATRQVNAFASSGHSEFLTFDYTVQSGDYDPDGFSIAAGALTLPAGGRVLDRGARAANLNLGRHAISGAAGHRVNNAPPSFGSTTVANRTLALDAPIAPLVLPEATGEGILSYTLTPSTLPQGLTWTPATRTIAGTPTAVTAARTYTWKATDSEDETATLTFIIAVAEIPTITLTVDDNSVDEGDGATTITVTATVDGTTRFVEDKTIEVSVAGSGTATAVDFAAVTDFDVEIAAGAASGTGTFTLTPTDDVVDEADETVTVSGSSSGLTVNPATISLTDNDATPTLSIDSWSVNEGDSGAKNLTFTVTLSAASGRQVTVDWADAGTGTTTSGTDYTAITGGTLTFATGTTSRTFNVSVTGDTTDELDETVVVTLSGATNATISTATGTGTIIDDDGAPTLSIDSPSVTEGDSGAVNLTFTVTLSAASGRQVTVAWADAGTGTATSGTDYTALTAGTLVFAAGTTSRTFNVSVTGDTTDEVDETVVVTLRNPTNATVSSTAGTGTGTITDDDSAPTLSIDSPSVTEGDSGAKNLTFTVTLSASSGKQVTVDWADAGTGTATGTGTDYTAITGGTLTFAAGTNSRTFNVSVTGDVLDESNETVVLTLSSATNATISTATGTGTITDDDSEPSLSIDSPSVMEGNSGSKNLTFTVTLSAASGRPVTVDYADAETGTATSGTDYTAITGGTLTFAAGTTSRTFNVSVTGDTTAESNETVVVTLRNPTNATVSSTAGTGTGTIAGDDTAGVTYNPTTLTVTEEGPSQSFTVVLNSQPPGTVWVGFTPESGILVADDTSPPYNITFNQVNWNTPKTVSVRALADNNSQDETRRIKVVVTQYPGANVPASANRTAVTVTVIDDDKPAVSLSLSPSSIPENGGAATVTATLDEASTTATTITVSAVAGTDADSSDFTLSAAKTLTIAAGSTTSTGTVTITAVNDTRDEPDKRVTVSGSVSHNGVMRPSNRTLTITDDDPAPTLSIDSPSVTEGDSGATNLTFTATLSAASGRRVTVDWAGAGGTATSGTDYVAVTGGTLAFAAGTTSRTFNVSVTGDVLDESNETVAVSLSNAANATVSSTAGIGTGTITDDDAEPSLSIDSPSVTEGDIGSRDLTFTVRLSAASGRQVTVAYADAGTGGATSGTDYTAITGGTLIFAAGAISRTFNVSVTGDVLDESNETVVVSLGNAANATVSTTAGTGTGTITDDDTAGVAKIPSFGSVAGPALHYQVHRSNISFSLPAAAGGDGAVTYALAATPALPGGLEYAPPAAGAAHGGIISGLPWRVAPRRTYTLTATDAVGNAAELAFTVVVNAAPGVMLAVANGSIPELGGSTMVTATLSHASSAATTITVIPVAGAYTVGSDATIVIPAGDTANAADTASITAVNDTIDNVGDRAVTVRGSASNAQGVMAVTGAALTLTDNEATPTVTLFTNPEYVAEGGSAAVTARLNHASSETIRLTVSAAASVNTAAGDFTLSSARTLTIAAGSRNSTGAVTIATRRVTTDSLIRGVDIEATVSGASGVANPAGITLPVLDNDGAPTVTLSLSDSSISEAGGTATVTATLNRASSVATRITIASVSGFYTAGSDFHRTTPESTIVIAAGETANTADTATIVAVDNDTDSPNRSVQVRAQALYDGDIEDFNRIVGLIANRWKGRVRLPTSLVTGNVVYGLDVNGATLTLEDDDAPPWLMLVAADSSISENNGTTAVRATLNRPSSAATTVSMAVFGPSTTAPAGDYTLPADTTLTIAAGKTASADTVTVGAVDNPRDEPDRRLVLQAVNPQNSQGIGQFSGVPIAITDDDDAPTVRLALADSSIPENGGTTTVTATLSHPSSQATTVTVAGVSGFYTVGSDVTIVIPARRRSNTADTVSITAVDDTIDDPGNRRTTITGSASNTQGVGSVTGAALTLIDDDATPTVTLALSEPDASKPDTVNESGAGNSSTVTATLSGRSSAEVILTVAATAGSNAVAGDFALSSAKTLTIAAGSTASTGAVTVTAVDDTKDAPDKEVTVTATVSGTSGVAAPSSVTLTIIDDDDAPAVTLAVVDSSVSENGGSTTVTATLSHPSSADTAITVTASAGTGAVATDFTQTGATLTVAAGATRSTGTVTVTANDDTTDAPDKEVTISGSAVNAQGVGAVTGTTLTITDDDAAPGVVLGLSPSSVSESGGVSTVTATLTHPSSAATTVTVTPVSGFYTVGSDAVMVIAAGSTVSATDTATVAAVDNAKDEPDRTATVTATLANSQGAGTVSGAALTVTDDDDAPGVVLALSPSSISESGGVSTVTASLSHPSSAATTVTVTPVSGFYTVGSDAVIVIAAGSTVSATDTATVAAVNDAIDNVGNRSATVTGTAENAQATAESETMAVTGAALTLTDDEATPEATLVLSPATIDEFDGTNVGASTVTATLNRASSEVVTLTVAATAVAPASASDFSLSSAKTLTIAAEATASTGAVTVKAVDDTTDAPDKEVTVSAAVSGDSGVAAPDSETLTIEDDEAAPTVRLAVADSAIAENDGSTTVTATLSHPSSAATTVTVTPVSGFYTVGSDAVIVIAAGETANATDTATVAAVDNATDAPDRAGTVTVTVSNDRATADGTTLAVSGGALTVTDDDTAPNAKLSLNPSSVSENGGASAVSATLTHPSSEPTTVTVTPVSGAYTVGSDATIVIAAGSTANATDTAAITAVDNATDEPDRTATVTATLANSQGAGTVSGATLTLEDDDDAPGVTLALSPSSIAENGGVSTVTATLSRASSAATTVTVTRVSGFYTVGSDAEIVIAAGSTANTADTATVAAVDNATDAPDRAGTVTVTVSNDRATADGTTLAVSGGALTVTDDDDAPNAALSLNPASVSENGGASTVSATLTHPSSAATTVTVTPLPGFYTVGSDAEIVIAAGSTANATDTATVAAVDNAKDEPDRTATVTATLTNSQGAGTVSGATLTLEDDDDAPGLSIDSPRVDEGDSGSKDLTFTVTLSAASGRQVTVAWADATTGTATAGTDYTAISAGTLTFAAGETAKTLTVSVTGDTTDEPDETVVVSLSGAANAVLGTASGTGTITDDDATPTVTLALSEPDASKPDTVNESGAGNSSTVTATLSGRSSAEVILTVAATAGANAVAGDFTLSSAKTLTIAAGSTASAGAVTVTAVDDTKDAPDKEVTVSATVSGTSGVAAPSSVTLTITDDDAAPAVTLAVVDSSISENGGSTTVTATLSHPSSADTAITVTASAGTGAVATDFTQTGATLTVAAGATTSTGTVTVTANDDTTDAPDKEVTISGSAVNAQGVGAVTGTTLTITDDEGLPTVGLVLLPSSISESGGVSTVTATLSGASSEAVTVTVGAAAVAPAVSGDFTLSTANTLTIAAGSTASTGAVTVTAVGNAADAPDKAVTVSGTAAGGNGVAAPSSVTLTITDDDDAPGLSIDSPRVDEGDSGTVSLEFTVSLGAASGRQVTVGYADAGTGTATSGTDYTAISARTLTFAAGETAKTLTVLVTGDTTDEPDETVVVSLSGAANAAISTASGTGTITDDDATPAVTLALSEPDVSKPDTVDESGAGNSSTVTATLSGRSSAEVILTVAATAGANAVAGDFTLSSAKTLTIAAGSTVSTGAVTVTAVDDTKDAPDKSVTVSATVSGTSGVAAPSSVTLTITDDDDAPGLSIDSPRVDEGDSGTVSLEFTVSLGAASGRQVTVGYADAGTGTAASGTDYTAIGAGTLTFAAGETAKTLTVLVTGDTTDEPDETVVVSLSGAANAAISTASGTGTITDDDATPTVTLALSEPDASKPDTVNESGAGNSSTVTATLSGPSSEAVTLTVAAAPGANAVAGDFTLSSAKTLTIAAGSTASTGAVTVTAVDDTKDAPDKEVTVTATVSGTSGVAAPSSVTLTITDDDDAPSLSIDSPRVDEGDSGSVSLEFTVSLGAASGRQVTVGYADAGTGTAASGTDYTAISAGTLTFAAGETAKTLTVSVTGDTTDEPDETVVVSLSGAVNAVISTASGTGTITDDDATPAVTLALSEPDVSKPDTVDESGAGNSSTVTATLSGRSSAEVILTVAAMAGANAVAGDFALSSAKTLTIAAGSTASTGAVTVTAVDDTKDAPDKSVTVSATVSGSSGVAAPPAVTLTITDDDDAPGLSISSPRVDEGDSGSVSLEFTVSLGAASGRQVTVGYADAGTGTATSGTDYTAIGAGTLTFAAGETAKTLTVLVTGDTTDEPDETVVVSLSGAANAAISTASGTGTITDDDATPTVTLALSEPDASKPDTVNESGAGNSSTVTATLSGRSSAEVILTVAATAGANAVAGDFTLSSAKTLTIAAGSTASVGTVTVTAVDDTKDAPDKEVTVTAVVSGSSGVAAPPAVTLTITDDDDAPSLSIDSPRVDEGDSGSVSLEFTVSLGAASGRQVTVGYADAGTGTAASGTDYTAISAGTLTFAAGETAKTLTVSVTGDTTDEPDETVVVSLSGAVNAAISTASGTGTITDDDAAPEVLLSVASSSIPENGGSTTVSATLTHPSSAATTVTVTPVANAYTVASGSDAVIVIAAGSTASATDTATITAVDNAVDAADSDVTVMGTAANTQATAESETMTVTGASLTITDDDTAGLAVSPSTSASSRLRTTEDGGTAAFEVKLGSEPTGDVVLGVASSDPAEGTVSASSLTFTATTWSTAQTVTLTGVDDAPANPVDGDRSYTVTLTVNTVSTADPTYDALSAITVYAVNADNEYGLDVGSVTGQATETGGQATFTVALLTRPSAAVTVSVTSLDASEGAASPSSLTFTDSDWNTTQTVTVTGADDAIDDGGVTWNVRLAPSSGDANYNGLSNVDVLVTTTDDDDAPGVTLALSPSSIAENGGGSTVTATLSRASSAATTVRVTPVSGFYKVGSDAEIVIAAGETANATDTATVAAVDNATDAPDRAGTVTVTVSNDRATADGTTLAVSGGALTVTDDDAAPNAKLSLNPSSVSENGGASAVSATLTHPSSEPTTVTVTPVSGAYTVGSDATIVIAAGSTANVTDTAAIAGVDNATDEPDRTATVTATLTNSQGAGTVTGATLTLEDDDDAPGVTLALSPSSIAESGGGSTVTATLSRASSAATTVTVTPVSGFYTVGSDAVIVIAAGETANAADKVTIAAVDNATDAPDRAGTVTVTVSNDRATADGTTLAVSGGALTVTDDDAAPNAKLSLNPSSVSENGGASAVSATLTHPSSEPTTVTVTPVSGFYTVGSDAVIVIAAGSTANATDTATVAAVDNAMDEPDRTATVSATLNNSQGAGTVTGATLTLEDDDDAPGLSISSPRVDEGDSGTVSLEFTVSLGAASGRQVTVGYADAGTGTATSGTDYTAITGGTLTFAAGTTSQTFDVSVLGDVLDESNETVVVSLSNAGNATIATASGTGTITDDDDAPTLSIASPSVAEGDSGSKDLTFTVTLSAASGQQVTVAYADAGSGTATSGTDYTAITGGTLTFAAGTTSQTFDVSVLGDVLDESNETVVVSLSSPTNAAISNTAGTGTGTITDDDDAPTLSMDSPSVTEGDSGTKDLTFTVTLSAASGQQVTVAYADAGSGTATSGTDYTAITGGTLTFAAGTTSRTFDVSVTGDTLDESNETVVVELSSPTNAAVSNTTGTGTGTITDDDDAPTLSITSPSVAEGDSGTTNLTFTVTLSAASGQEVTVAYADAGSGTATSGTDYTAITGGTLTFAAGTTSRTFNVSVTGDTLDESNETVVVTLSSPTNAAVSNTAGTGTGTITDDDDAPTLSIASPSVAEGDSGSADLTFTVTLSAASGQQVTVAYADAGSGTATSGTDYTAITGGTLTFTAGTTSQTFDVSVTGDTLDEANETVVVTLSSPTNAAVSNTAGTGTGTITDDDDAPTLSMDSPSVTEGDSGTTNLTFTVTLSAASGQEVTVAYADAGSGTATSGTDYTAITGGTLTFAAGNDQPDLRRVGDGRHAGRVERDGGGVAEHPDERDRVEYDGHRHGDDHGRRRCADAVDGLTERDGGGQRHDEPDVHGDVERGERPAGDGGLRRRHDRHGHVGDGLHGDRGRDADLRGGDDQPDLRRVGDGRHAGRVE